MKQIPILIRAFAPSRLRAFALACALPLVSWAQQTVSGTVTDDNGLPLPGATVVVQNTNRGTTTDFDGKYQIQAIQGETLTFSYVGYASQNITVGSNATINVQMEPTGLLEEVVITAYGTTTKEAFTGSAGLIGSDEISLRSATSPIGVLEGNTT
ncbi:MAG: carboxypeptidase-like regulatory domain-containing protein [Flavobacteriaceae bacterium]